LPYKFYGKGPTYVYIIHNTVSRKNYVGQSYNPKNRFLAHIYAMRGRGHEVPDMTRDYDAYGEESFVLKILCKCETKNEARTKECFYMKVLRSQEREHGYNYHDKVGTGDIPILDRWRTSITEQCDRHRLARWSYDGIYVEPKDPALRPTDYWWNRSMNALAQKWSGTWKESLYKKWLEEACNG
jgi:group I intron endonuclease